MKLFLKILFWIIVLSFVISGIFGLFGALLGMTFGIIGAVMKFVWRLVFNPVALILVIIYLAYRLRERSNS